MRNLIIVSTCVALAVPMAAAVAQENTFTPQISPPPAPVIAPVASAEPEISLEELLRRAAENNPRLQIAGANVEAASQRVKSGRALPNPTLQLVPGFTGNSAARDEDVILAQPLDVFGVRRARSGVLSADLRRAEALKSLARRALEIEVRNAASLLFAAQEAEKLEQVQAEIAGLFREAAARRAAVGDVPAIQVQRAELEWLRAQNDLAQARAVRLSRRTVLNQLIGSAPNAPLRVALPVEATATALLGSPGTIGSASGNGNLTVPQVPATSAVAGGELVGPDADKVSVSELRPDVLSAQATLEARQAQVKAIRKELLPAVELQARRSAFFGRDGSYALRAVVTVPVFDFGEIKGKRRAAEAEVRAQEATVQLLRQQSAAQALNARIVLQTRRETVARYQGEMLPLALDLLRKTQIGYAQGASTYLEVLEAQRALRGVQAAYLQALVGVQTGETALDAAINGGVQLLDNGFNFSGREVMGNDSP
ncbi:cobalt-zinc-cadmium resistance protein CzcC [Abditibacteriota bacterium]|nr:cobalt-zinc-cadmium resistance protein CzcC [Abditibacteriota bacterium]